MYHLNTTYQDIITTFLLYALLHHVGMLRIIKTHEQLQYDMDAKNSEWTTGGPWYNTNICKKLHGKVFEVFIRNARTDRYNIMCYIGSHEKDHQSSCYDGNSGGGCTPPSNSTTESLDFLGATVDIIDCWIKSLERNLIERCNLYSHHMVTLFQRIPVKLPNQHIPKEKLQSL